MMARSPTLDTAAISPNLPSAMAFAEGPGQQTGTGVGLGFTIAQPINNTFHEQEQTSSSSISVTSSDFHSPVSSPAGSTHASDGDGVQSSRASSRLSSTYLLNGPQQPDTISPGDALGGPVFVAPERKLNGKPSVNTIGPQPIQQWVLGAQAPVASSAEAVDYPLPPGLAERLQDQGALSTATPTSTNVRGQFFNTVKSASPVSSVGSASINTSNFDYPAMSFEAQLKTSPTIRDLLDRLTRCEVSNREIQRQLVEVHGKVNLLVERSLASFNGEPEFKNPFAPVQSNMRSLTPSGLGPMQFSPQTNVSLNASVKGDDISQLSQRINTLTTSVGQLLALQTRQHMNSVSQAFNQNLSPLSSVEVAPNQIVSPPPPPIPQASLLGHGLPNRPELRQRNPGMPLRTWSAGNLELPIRPPEGTVGRVDSALRDKRRSVSGLLRRESTGIIESPNEPWVGGSPRESGPVASKWEQLPLAPELLRSLAKFGVGPPNKIQQRALPFLLKGADIIAQAPPTQERIAAYVIPAIHVALCCMSSRAALRGPAVLMISTTVDQATQAQRMIRDLGTPVGVRSALGVGAVSPGSDLSTDIRILQQNIPHILCGTPQKLHALFSSPNGISGADVRFLVLDEVDQLIARNLHEFVFNIVKLLPAPRSRGPSSTSSGASPPSATGTSQFTNPFESVTAGPSQGSLGRRFSVAAGAALAANEIALPQQIERQTALFSNTVPQDVLNFANTIHLREPVRVLVRRDGNVVHTENVQGTKGLRQFYLYLAFTSGSRSEPIAATPGNGHGIIGSGRGASNAETAQAREWKLDALVDLLDDIEVPQIIIHVGGMTALDAVVYKLASRGMEAVPLHSDMNAGTKLAALNKFRGTSATMPMMRQPATKVLVVYDVQVKAPADVFQVPLVINYDLPQAVEEYAHRVAPAIANNYTRAGVVVNFVTATGGDVEMLRSIECFYKIKCPEVPISLRDLLQ